MAVRLLSEQQDISDWFKDLAVRLLGEKPDRYDWAPLFQTELSDFQAQDGSQEGSNSHYSGHNLLPRGKVLLLCFYLP